MRLDSRIYVSYSRIVLPPSVTHIRYFFNGKLYVIVTQPMWSRQAAIGLIFANSFVQPEPSKNSYFDASFMFSMPGVTRTR